MTRFKPKTGGVTEEENNENNKISSTCDYNDDDETVISLLCPSQLSRETKCLGVAIPSFTEEIKIVHSSDASSSRNSRRSGRSAPPLLTMSRLHLSDRDPPVMESCETRTVIEPDKELNESRPRSVHRDNSEAHHYLHDDNDNSTSNYFFAKKKRCTEIITTLLMTTMTMAISKINIVWKNSPLNNNYHHRHKHQRRRHDHVQSTRSSNCLRTFVVSVLTFLLSCTSSSMMITLVHGQPPPLPPAGFLDFDNLPVTRFSCEGKVIGGYYADVETGCQMFHVCTLGQKDEIQDIKFLCLNGTVFDQETRVCERVDEVDCSKAEQFFDLNLDLYVPHATTPKPEEADLEEEDDIIRPVQASSKPKTTTTTTTTRATTTTTTPTPSPRTRPPTPPPKVRSPPVISSSSSSQQIEEEEEEDEDDRRNGNNAYTSFNYYLKTPHSHVASGYNSQSRQSYLFNQPQPSRSSSGKSGSNTAAATSSTGRKVPSGSGQKTIVYTSSSTSSSSTQKPKTVVVVKATLPPSKSILKPKTLATPRITSTTTTTPLPPTKYELDEQYDEYYDDEDYTVEQPPAAAQSSSKQSSFQPTYPVSKPALTSSSNGYEYRDGRSTKGIGNAGQTIVSSTTGKSSNAGKVSVAVQTSTAAKASIKPVSTPIKVVSSEFFGNNSTEEPYYYEDDYPDDVTLQQQQQEHYRNPPGYGTSSSSSSNNSGRSSTTSPSTSNNLNSKSKSSSLTSTQKSSSSSNDKSTSSAAETDSDYYDDNDNVNAHDHHFTHVDVPRIPYAKPNVPRVLVTNGKPFLPRLRRQSHHHQYYSTYPHPHQQSQHSPMQQHFLLPSSSSSSSVPARSYRRSLGNFYDHSIPNYNYHQNHPSDNGSRRRSDVTGGHLHPLITSQHELRQEARAKARAWGRDQFR